MCLDLANPFKYTDVLHASLEVVLLAMGIILLVGQAAWFMPRLAVLHPIISFQCAYELKLQVGLHLETAAGKSHYQHCGFELVIASSMMCCLSARLAHFISPCVSCSMPPHFDALCAFSRRSDYVCAFNAICGGPTSRQALASRPCHCERSHQDSGRASSACPNR